MQLAAGAAGGYGIRPYVLFWPRAKTPHFLLSFIYYLLSFRFVPYKKWAIENGKKYFSVASGGGTGRTLHPDNVAAGPASYGLTDSLGRVHGDAQFAGSSSVPAHVEMMGLIGMGNNPMVGATVACAVAAAQANA